MEMIIKGRDGALTTYEIIGDAEKAAEIVRTITTYRFKTTDTGISGSANKREINAIRRAIESVSSRAVQERRQRPSYASRYIALLETAQREGLNHGKPWICGEIDVDSKGACPSFEGLAICYVYNE